MKQWKIALVLVLALGLVLGVASPALAAPPWASRPQVAPPTPRIIRGEVASVEGNTSFTVQSGWYQATVAVNDETEYFKASVPSGAVSLALRLGETAEAGSEGLGLRQRLQSLVAGVLSRVPPLFWNRLEMRLEVCEGLGMESYPFGEEAAFTDIKVGSWVVVWAAPDGDNPVAEWVVIMEPTTYHHVRGTISSLDADGKTITIASNDGESIVLSYGEETRFILRGNFSLEVGETVRAVYDEAAMAVVVIVVASLD
jgi:hypothetical protein